MAIVAEVSSSVAPAASNPKDPPNPTRKRRRRAPTTGAADDCFACQEAQSQCDRRRPYCSQCIDRGKTCSGYKTQLTWGVGVASRGKLRGLSLPVAKSKKAVATEQRVAEKKNSISSMSTNSWSSTDAIKEEHESIPVTTSAYAYSSSTPTPTAFGFVQNLDSSHPAQSPAHLHPPSPYEWPAPPGNPHHNPSHALSQQQQHPPTHGPQRPKGIRRHSMQPLAMPPPIATPDWGPVPMTANVFGGFDDSGYSQSPMTPPFSGPEPLAIPKSYPQPHWAGSFPESYSSIQSINSWQSDAISSSLSSETASAGMQEDEVFYADPNLGEGTDAAGEQRYPHFHETHYDNPPIKEEVDEDDQHIETINPHHGAFDYSMAVSVPQFQSMQSILVGNTPALRNLINYYDKVIAPVIVAFDSSTNPFRTHILQMAHESDALQHAIAALSASNLRMRRDSEAYQPHRAIADHPHETTHDVSVRKSSTAHLILRDSIEQPEASTEVGKPSRTELYHKKESIRALNMSLAQGMDSPSANDDTVLATLLILCLYHICDTGVAKFKTQFAGVKKLMNLRNKSTTTDIQWLVTMFQWFDAMTATVNDREGQFELDTLFTPSFSSYVSSDDWSLENLAGCDGRLFKIISQLGRLNLLSQGKPVAPVNSPICKSMPPRHQSTDYYSLPTQPSSTSSTPQFDGNGYTSLLPEPDPAPTSSRAQFHAEWAALRQELLDWHFDASSVPPSMLRSADSGAPTSPDGIDLNAIDLLHISESFRYSALLYTERLARPTMPSNAPNFQAIVAKAMEHISAVKSDVYLLWPLFITGTECVDEGHREIVRRRCRAIQSDSGFYNNESTLGLLERVWERDRLREMHGCSEDLDDEGPFRWRKAMKSEEGEYIVI